MFARGFACARLTAASLACWIAWVAACPDRRLASLPRWLCGGVGVVPLVVRLEVPRVGGLPGLFGTTAGRPRLLVGALGAGAPLPTIVPRLGSNVASSVMVPPSLPMVTT